VESVDSTNQLDQSRPYSPREFLHLLGRELAEIATEDGVLTSAYKARVPIFCPAIADSGIAVGIAGSRFEKKNNFMFDLIQDVLDMDEHKCQSESDRRNQFLAAAPLRVLCSRPMPLRTS